MENTRPARLLKKRLVDVQIISTPDPQGLKDWIMDHHRRGYEMGDSAITFLSNQLWYAQKMLLFEHVLVEEWENGR